MDNEIFLDESISLDSIKRIEAIRGPGGVFWGATAFVGIINIVTKEPGEDEGGKITLEGGSYNTYKYSLRYSKKLTDDLSIFTNYSELRTEDYKVKSNELRNPLTGNYGDGWENSERKEDMFRELFLKLKYKDFTLTTRLADEIDYYQIQERGRAVWHGFDMEDKDPVKELIRLDYEHGFENFKLKNRIWTMLRESYLTGAYFWSSHPTGNLYWIYDTWKARQDGAEIEFSTDKLIPNNVLIIGATFIHQYGDNINTWDDAHDWTGGGSGDTVDPVWFYDTPVSGMWLYGGVGMNRVIAGPGEKVSSLFISDEYKVNPNSTVSLGYRYDKNSAYDAVNHFSLNYVHKVQPGHYIKYMFSQGFRPADWEQKNSGSKGGGDLQPEESESHDIQYNGRYGKNIEYFINYAKTIVDNLVLENSTTLRYENTGEKTIDSFEAECKYYLSENKGYCFLNYNYKKVDEVASGNVKYITKVPYVTQNITNLGMYYKWTSSIASATTIHYEGEKSMDFYEGGNPYSTNYAIRKIEGYYTVNLGIHYNLKNLSSSLFCYNLFDKEYYSRPRAGRNIVPIPTPQRNFMLKVSYMF